MKIFKTEQVKVLDAYTIEHEPISSEKLMERAAGAMTDWMYSKFDHEFRMLFFTGPGNNGGDGLVMARLMAGAGYHVRVCVLDFTDHLSPDCRLNYDRFLDMNGTLLRMSSICDFPEISDKDVIVDAVFGAGLSRPVDKFPAEVINRINQLPNIKVAIDVPSGLFGEDNSVNSGAVLKADYTLAIQFPKLSFFFPEVADSAGEWVVLDIGLHPLAIRETETPYYWLQKEDVAAVRRKRKCFDHKGSFGHALLIAGSYGKMGACVLSAKACLRSGAGLLTCHIPQIGYNILQITVPEAMISIDRSDVIFSQHPDLRIYSAVGIGPGLGQKANTQKAVIEMLRACQTPLVLDADALNCLSLSGNAMEYLPENSILTPHPKEFERLFGRCANSAETIKKQREIAQKHKIIVILKGAFTRIALPDGRMLFNSSGNPALATAGSGDVLTGIILALLAQNYSPEEAALAGVWIHGKVADKYVESAGEETMIASDIVDNLGIVFKELSV